MTQAHPSNDIRRDLVALLPRLRRFALTLTNTAADADLLVRDAAGRAIDKSHHWRGEGRLENWLFSLMTSMWADEVRKRRRTDQFRQKNDVSSDNGKPLNPMFALPEGCALAMLLIDVEGFSYEEASAILGTSSDLIASQLCTARLTLAQADRHSNERRA